PQILRAAQLLVDDGICTPVLLGNPERIAKLAAESNVNIAGMELMKTNDPELDNTLAQALWELRARKGMTLGAAKAKLREPNWRASMMVKSGLADGMVGGLKRPYKETIGPAIKVLGLREDRRI